MNISESRLRRLIREALLNAYEILGVSRNAGEDEIKRAWRKLALDNHPDRNPGKNTLDQMVKINVAKDILSNPSQRMRLDNELRYYGQQRPASPPNPGPAQRPGSPPPPPRDTERDKARQAKQDAEDRAWQGSQSSRRQGEYAPQMKTAYYIKQDPATNEDKFWHVTYDSRFRREGPFAVKVGFGRLGTEARIKDYNQFGTMIDMLDFIQSKSAQKQRSGYMRVNTETFNRYNDEAKANSASKKQAPPASKQSANPPPSASSARSPFKGKTSYKVYGPRFGAPVHARVAAKYYRPVRPTKFKSGDKAEMAVGSDGRLSVHDPVTKNTQSWERQEEAFQTLIDDLLIEELNHFSEE